MQPVGDTKYARWAELGAWALRRNREAERLAEQGSNAPLALAEGHAEVHYTRDPRGWFVSVTIPLGPVETLTILSGVHKSAEAAAADALKQIDQTEM